MYYKKVRPLLSVSDPNQAMEFCMALSLVLPTTIGGAILMIYGFATDSLPLFLFGVVVATFSGFTISHIMSMAKEHFLKKEKLKEDRHNEIVRLLSKGV